MFSLRTRLGRVKSWLRQARRARPHAKPSLEPLESRELLAPGDFRMASYNIAASAGPPRSGLDVILRAIGDEVVNGRSQPLDILALQEVQSQATTTQAVVNLLNGIYGPGVYARGTLDGATTGFGRPGLAYNTQNLQLVSEVAVGTASTTGQPRQAIRYHFHPVGFPATADFYVYNSHYDAGSTPARRLVEAQAIRADADALGPNTQVIYIGDYNAQTYTEDGYQHLLSPGPGQAFDPLSRPARWRDDLDSLDILTQTPAFDPPSPLTGGGLDDRFDQQLITAALFDGGGLDYRYGSLHAFGNNGSVPLNGNINDPASTALPGLPNRLEVLNLLTTVSDHLPVVGDYTVNVPPALTVRWVEATRTGFTIRFDRPIDPSVLNLYDTQTGGLGPADITLVGRSSGPVTGSRRAAPDSRSVTFTQTGWVTPSDLTGGVLPQDVYTVTLRSAVNGFKDAAGGLLDGNGDGTAGDSFASLFSIPFTISGTVTVSVPDFMRGPGQAVNVPATAGGIPLRVSNGNGITSITLAVRFNPSLLTIAGATPVPAGSSATLDTSTPGVATLTFTSPTPLGAGLRDLVTLAATVPDNAGYGSKHVLDLADIRINGGTIPPRDDDGLHVVGYFGDTSGSAGYSAVDAQRALRLAVGLDGGLDRYRLADPILIADVTENGTLNATDATRILQEAVGIDQAAIPPLPLNPPTIVMGGPDPLLRFPRRLRGRPGETVRVPLFLDPAAGLESADLAIAYDVKRLEVVGVHRGRLTKGFDLFAANHDAEAGTIRVGLSGPTSGRGRSSVIEIIFRVRSDAPAGRATVNLLQGLGPTKTQLNEGGLDLNPDPGDGADELDGAVVVRR